MTKQLKNNKATKENPRNREERHVIFKGATAKLKASFQQKRNRTQK